MVGPSQCSWLLAQSQDDPKGQFPLLTSGCTSFSIQLLKSYCQPWDASWHVLPFLPGICYQVVPTCLALAEVQQHRGICAPPLSQWPEFILLTIGQPFCFVFKIVLVNGVEGVVNEVWTLQAEIADFWSQSFTPAERPLHPFISEVPYPKF